MSKKFSTSQRTNPVRKKPDNGQCQNFSDPSKSFLSPPSPPTPQSPASTFY